MSKSLFFSIFLLVSIHSLAQFEITGLQFQQETTNDSHCSKGVSISLFPVSIADELYFPFTDIQVIVEGMNFTPGNCEVEINWGDGETTTSQASMTNIDSLIATFSHEYISSGDFDISVCVTNLVNGTNSCENFMYSVPVCREVYFNLNIALDCNNDGFPESIVDEDLNLIGPTSALIWNHYTIEVRLGTYQVSLFEFPFENEYLVNQISPNPFVIDLTTDTIHIDMVLNCVANQSCVNGWVFCDDNANGFWDESESVIENAKLYHTNATFSSDENGYYFYVRTAGLIHVSIDQQWLAENDFTAENLSVTAMNAGCPASGATNIPILCLPTAGNESLASPNGISLYPNPIEDELSLVGLSANSKIDIINLNGQLIQSYYYLEGQTINVDFLDAGVYILKSISDGEVFSERIVIK